MRPQRLFCLLYAKRGREVSRSIALCALVRTHAICSSSTLVVQLVVRNEAQNQLPVQVVRHRSWTASFPFLLAHPWLTICRWPYERTFTLFLILQQSLTSLVDTRFCRFLSSYIVSLISCIIDDLHYRLNCISQPRFVSNNPQVLVASPRICFALGHLLLGFWILEAFLACRLPIMGLLKAALFASIVLGATGTPLDGK